MPRGAWWHLNEPSRDVVETARRGCLYGLDSDVVGVRPQCDTLPDCPLAHGFSYGIMLTRSFTWLADLERSRLKQGTIIVALWAASLVLTGCGGVITPETESGVSPPFSTGIPPALPTTAATSAQPTLITATPTASPTPIFHVVQPGETLGGIAAIYEVSVQALQIANGIENPLLLQVGQELVIPTGEEVLSTEPELLLPTPTPLPFGWGGIGFYETPVGSLWCLGEVVNTTPYTLTNLQVQVTLYDAAGTPLIAGDAPASADILPPAARAPFGVLFLSPPPNFASHQIAILRGEFTGGLPEVYVPLVVEQTEGVPSGPQFEVSGTVRNANERLAVSAVVVVTTYDGEGRVTGFRQQMVEVGEGLALGGAAAFQLLLTTHGDTPADFSVIAFGRTSTGGGETQPGE
jgi:LysM repeat protein